VRNESKCRFFVKYEAVSPHTVALSIALARSEYVCTNGVRHARRVAAEAYSVEMFSILTKRSHVCAN
jgi:hypothetical protein